MRNGNIHRPCYRVIPPFNSSMLQPLKSLLRTALVSLAGAPVLTACSEPSTPEPSATTASASVEKNAVSVPAQLAFAPQFRLALADTGFNAPTVFNSGELAVKNSDGRWLAGSAVTHTLESLPTSFDLHNYPLLLLSEHPQDELTSELSSDLQERFLASRTEAGISYDLSSLRIDQLPASGTPQRIIYSACRDQACLGFVVKPALADVILMLHASGLEQP
ncbi:MAG: hypothetical protein CMI08_08680 [Oceanospirillaceae bacterium]|nr:hypothetical protein [Oceanospirillaceae bacterium]